MKKSEKYYYAMLCVLESEFDSNIKLEILEELIDVRNTALFVEKRDAEKEEQA